MRKFFRRLGRGIVQVLLWPFRALGWLLRGLGHVLGEVVEFVVDLVIPS